jgi:hypothetical protein
MKFSKILIFLATISLLGCPESKPEQKSKTLSQFYEFEPVYIKVQNKVNQKKPQKTKFYNFDDLLINGEYKKPKSLYLDAKQKVKFEKLLKLKKDFLPNLKNTQKDPSLR